jgi:hypothetical protein
VGRSNQVLDEGVSQMNGFVSQLGISLFPRGRWAVLLVALTAGVFVVTTNATASTVIPLPPYNQCPSLGRSPSCKVLLVVEPSGSVTVYDDSSVGDYDGGDDTLVGIGNNSATTVTAVTVSPGSYLSSFDNDGLCSYITCTWPTATGYEGPMSTFVTKPSLPDSAEVDFTGGLKPGATTYFSLEGTLTAATLTGRQGTLSGVNYAALGDSYSSGEGNAPYLSGTDVSGSANDKCHRSVSNGYPDILAADPANGISSSTFPFPGFVACSGATRGDLWNGNSSNHEATQLNAINSSTNVVTIGIGRDDVGFADVLKRCITVSGGPFTFHGNAKCANTPVMDEAGNKVSLDADEKARIADLGTDQLCQEPNGYVICRPSLATIYEQIAAQAAPNVKIRVLLYPHLFTNTPANSGCTLIYAPVYVPTPGGIVYTDVTANVSNANIAWLNQGVNTLDQKIRDEVTVAKKAGIDVQAVDPRGDFNDDAGGASPGGHGVCTKQPWIAGLTLSGFSVGAISFHPLAQGQRTFAGEIGPTIR